MTYERTQRIRRAAILVASLDEALAEALLSELPPQEAAKVLGELDRLESIDPEEQADVLDEFRRATRRGEDLGAVEFTYSAPTPVAALSAAESTSDSSALVDADVAAMAELLSREQPQIVAAALSRLSGELGAAVFAALPNEMHAEVVDRVSRLTLADEESVLEVESQLQRKVDERRERRERAAAGAELARRLLARTPPHQQAVLLERISAQRISPAQLPTTPRPFPHISTSGPQWSPRATTFPALTWRAQRGDLGAGAANDLQRSESEIVLEDPSHALEALRDDALVAALQRVDDETGLRALAAASEGLVKRISRRLPRGQARKLRRLLRSFGPTRLADLRRAQHEVLRMAHEFVETNATA